MTPPILQQLRQLEDLCFYHLFYSSEINRLRGGMFSRIEFVFEISSTKNLGPLIRDILQNIENLKSKNGMERKVKIYSGVREMLLLHND